MSQKRQKQPLFLHSNSFLSSYRLAILGMSLKIILLKFIALGNNSYEHKYPGMSQASFGAHPLVIKYLPFTISTFSWCLQAFLSLTKHKTKRTKQSFVDSFIALRRLNANFVAQISWSLYSDILNWTPRSVVSCTMYIHLVIFFVSSWGIRICCLRYGGWCLGELFSFWIVGCLVSTCRDTQGQI